jgi:hypothetical protein
MIFTVNEEIINIAPVDLENQKPAKEGTITLELHEKYIAYRARFYAEEPVNVDDKELGWQTVYNNFDIIADKRQCVCVEKNWLSKAKRWAIYVYVNGLGYDIKMYFKKETEAQEIFDKIFNWLYA